MKTAVECKGLVKKYGDKIAVDGVDLEVYQGEIFGLLGPNGAGKSTVLKMMYGSSSITAGELFVLGLNSHKNFRDIKSRVGILPQNDGLDSDFSAVENILLFARYHGIDPLIATRRSEELLRLMRLEMDRHKMISELSGGMRKRLSLARAMVNNPELLFLDEPTAGLDPNVRVWIWDFMEKIRKEMGTVIMTTHYMEEAERLCDRIAIMENGKILAIGKPKDLIQSRIGVEVVELDVAERDISYYLTRLKEHQYRFQVVGRSIHVYLNANQDNKEVVALIFSKHVHIRAPNLNDVFMSLAGHDLETATPVGTSELRGGPE